MGLEYKTSAKRRFDAAEVRGNGPFALASVCYPKRLVLLFESRAARDAKLVEWNRCDCGWHSGYGCFGASGHRIADDLKGYPATLADAAAMPRLVHFP